LLSTNKDKRTGSNPNVGRKFFPWKNALSRFSLGKVLTVIVCSAIALSTLIISYYSLQKLYESKVTDQWTIAFLDLEQRNHRLTRELEIELNARKNELPSSVFEVKSDNRLMDTFSNKVVPISELGFSKLSSLVSEDRLGIKVITNGGRYFFADYRKAPVAQAKTKLTLPKGKYIFVWEFDLKKVVNRILGSKFEGGFYLANSSSQLVFSNRSEISQDSYNQRPLVRFFIDSPLTQGQTQIEVNDSSFLGLFQEIPGTNLISFLEAKQNDALALVWETVVAFGGYFIMILLVSILVVQVPVLVAVRPIVELAAIARESASGNFSLRSRKRSYGEVETLAAAVDQMNSSLDERDRKNRFSYEQSIREMANALDSKVSDSIKDHLVRAATAPEGAPFSYAFLYEQPHQFASDWFGIHFNPDLNVVTFALADASGDKVQAGFVSAMVAALFSDFSAATSSMSLRQQFERMNSALFKAFRGKQFCSLLIGEYFVAEKRVEYISSGIEPPLFLTKTSKANPHEHSLMPIQPVGMSSSVEWGGKEPASVSFSSGDSLLFYSDGLRFHRRKSFSSFGRRKIYKLMETNRALSAGRAIEHLKTAWYRKAQEQGDGQRRDGMCAVIIKAV
jgi:serine phosphatase RsbU (regulator of sigma subunit)